MKSYALLCWNDISSTALAAARWSPTRPCVFFVLDTMGNMFCFDLCQSTSGPTAVVPGRNSSGSSSSSPRACCLETSGVINRTSRNDRRVARVTSDKSTSSHTSQSGTTDGNACTYSLGYDDGHIEVHILPEMLRIKQPNELEVLNNLLA
eukprot:jgi/Chrzof1/4321/Cz14g08240.t1